eukprot:TRINITY_DN9714_c0_g1_i1.p1 TRINITY_DN9714_c0_g1~~TRINITY_DN9714_c0_g1_i1.p1  ORF type:complete len:666 (+),score=118.68 TRINITY_DN9714_c0_g1_i1:2391-4388(+)
MSLCVPKTDQFVSCTLEKSPLEIYTRPEIRKGCVWEILLRFSPDFVQQHSLKQIYVEKPRSGFANATYLCLKVRSKLIKPVRELPFIKVATVVNEGESLSFNDLCTLTLKVRFTARPRAVFHKHSDMMILLVSVKKGDVVLATSEAELIFRGGTGSVHSAEIRKSVTPRDSHIQLPPPLSQPPSVMMSPIIHQMERESTHTLCQPLPLDSSTISIQQVQWSDPSQSPQVQPQVQTPAHVQLPVAQPQGLLEEKHQTQSQPHELLQEQNQGRFQGSTQGQSQVQSQLQLLLQPQVQSSLPLHDQQQQQHNTHLSLQKQLYLQYEEQSVPLQTPWLYETDCRIRSDRPEEGENLPYPRMLELEEFSPTQFCHDFIENKGDVLLSSSVDGFGFTSGFEDLMLSNSDANYPHGLWAERLFEDSLDSGDAADNFSSSLGTSTSSSLSSSHREPTSSSLSIVQTSDPVVKKEELLHCPSSTSNENLQNEHKQQQLPSSTLPEQASSPETKKNEQTQQSSDCLTFTLVYGKRRGYCTRCEGECSFYKGSGGPCCECGCFPSQHVDLDVAHNKVNNDRPPTCDGVENSNKHQLHDNTWKKRSREMEDSELEELPQKRPRYLLEAKYFQKLFFNSLTYLTLPQISAICGRAPIPIFVKVGFFFFFFFLSELCRS